MKCLAVADTHGYHEYLPVYEDIDILFYAGDSTNYHDININQSEFQSFFKWLRNYPAKHKVVIAGNHDAWATRSHNISTLFDYDIIYLEHDMTTINGLTIVSSPYTPSYKNWYFMKNRSSIGKYWAKFPDKADIIITHGPPKGILDLTFEQDSEEIIMVGDKSLLNRVLEIKPKYHIFGHVHNNKDIINQGIRIYQDITFINCSAVNNGEFTKGLSSNGILFDI